MATRTTKLPKFIRAIQFNIEDPYGFYAERLSEDTLIDLAKRTHANLIIVFARDAWGRTFYDSRIYPRHPRAKLDIIKLTRKAHENSIAVLVMAAHTANRYIYRRHPEWAQRTRTGEVIVLEHVPVEERVRDPHWPQICPNSPAMEKYFAPEVKEAIEATGAEGVLLDSFRYIPDLPKACYCKWCRRLFHEEEGLELPERIDPENEAYRRAWEWRYRVIVRAIARLRTAAKEAREDALLFYNSHPAGWAGRPNRVVEMARDILDGVFAEASEVDVKGPGLLTVITKLSRSLIGSWSKPVLVTRNTFHFLRIVQTPPGPTLRIGIWEIVAAGGNPVATTFSSQFFEDNRYIDVLSDVYEKLESIEEYLTDSIPIPYVGLVFSNITHDWYIHHHPEYYVGEVEGFSDILMHYHVPWEFVADFMLEDLAALARYPILVAANTGILSDEAEEAIRDYVEQGGTLVVTHEFGVMRPDFTYRHALAAQDALGVRFEGLRRLGYVYVDLGAEGSSIYDEYWEGLPYRIPFGDYNTAFRRERRDPRLGEAVRIVPIEARSIARLRSARNGWGYEYTLGRSLPPPDSLQDTPAVTINRYGKGVVIYYGIRLGIHYDRFGHPDYAKLFLNPLRRHAPPQPVDVEAPDTVQAEYYRQKDRIVVHLVNHTFNQRFLDAPVTAVERQALPAFDPPYSVHPVRSIIPVRGVKIRIRVDGSKYLVKEPLEDREEVVEAKNGIVEYTVRELSEYSLVVIEPHY